MGGEPSALDRDRFKPVLDEFYSLHGWDESGRPTAEGLNELGLIGVYEPMIEGTLRADEQARVTPSDDCDAGQSLESVVS